MKVLFTTYKLTKFIIMQEAIIMFILYDSLHKYFSQPFWRFLTFNISNWLAGGKSRLVDSFEGPKS